MTKEGLWVSMPIMRNIAFGAERHGLALEELCRAAGIDRALLDQQDAVMMFEPMCQMMDMAMKLTNDPFLGLHTGELSTPVTLGLVGQLMETSPDLMTAFMNTSKYLSAVTGVYEYVAEVVGEEFRFYADPVEVWHNMSPETARMSVEMTYSGLLHIIRLLSSRVLYPVRIEMRYARPRDTSEYERVFKVMPQFNAPRNCMIFNQKSLQLPVIGHNPTVNQILKELLEKEIDKTRREVSFSNEVRRLILVKFDTTLPQLTDLVQYFNTTPRTIQRKLKEEGQSFQQIADSVKKELAINLLKNPALTVNEVAYRLGYAEPSVFRRAFKKWTGVNPKLMK